MTNLIQQKGHPYEYRPVNPQQILVDPLYQRELHQKKVDKIISEFNYDLVNEPKLSLRSDGKLYVFNGQHTTAAWKIHEGIDTPIMCKIYRGLTWEDEKELFQPFLYSKKMLLSFYKIYVGLVALMRITCVELLVVSKWIDCKRHYQRY